MPKDTAPMSGVQAPVMSEVRRVPYDLSHWTHSVGAIGSLQTQTVIPVIAGDTMSVNFSGVFRLSRLRRQMYLDAVVDLFAFYVPYRHIYDDPTNGWVPFMKAGFDEGVTLGTSTLAAQTVNNYNCFGGSIGQGTVVPRWLDRGYMKIYKRYFVDPSDTVQTALADTYFTGTPTAAEANYGLKCAHIKRMMNASVNSTLTSGDYSLPLSGGEVNLYELAALKSRLQTEQARDVYALRYQDVLKHTFDSTVNIDADQRPELIMRTRTHLSGHDVNGSDDGTLGSWVGKSNGLMHLNIPNKYFPEHGTLWIMSLVRFPMIAFNEYHYLIKKAEPTYAQIAGDPDIVRRTGPVALNINECVGTSTSVVLGNAPHSQWYREHPNLVHEQYYSSLGHPFVNMNSIATRNDAVYIPDTLYDTVFASLQFKHWQSQSNIQITAKRFVPDPQKSIFAGTE